MRREMMLLAGVMALTVGCGKGGPFSTQRPDRAAEAAGQELSAETLAGFMSASPNAKQDLKPEAVDFVANLWVDYTLFAQALATNKLTVDSALVAEAMWPMIAEQTATQWRDSLVSQRVEVSAASVDSAYKADQMRVGQHILILADSTFTPAQKAEARRKADNLLARLKGGANFGALAIANSQDPGSAADSGMMAPAGKGSFVAPFEKALWDLKPGQISDVVTTEYGFHIIRFPTLEEATSHWKPALSAQGQQAVEEAYFADLEKTANLKVQSGSVARMRAALADMEGKRKDNAKLVTWKGGAFTVADFIRWVKAATTDPMQGPALLQRINSAPDSQFSIFAKQLGQNSLLLADAEKHNIHMSAANWQAMTDGFKAEIDSIKLNMEIGPEVLDPAASKSDRSKAAALKVDAYFENLVKRQARLRFLPGMLAWTLRGRMDHDVNPLGTARALELAKAKVDSSAAGPGAITPAPGGPPVPDAGGAPAAPPPGNPATGGTKKP
jgi:hypothetical protein